VTLKEAAARIAGLECLLKYLFVDFGITPWTAADAIEAAAENGFVYGALVECIGKDFTVIKFSRFLKPNCGRWGDYHLRQIKRHSRNGAVFCVTKLANSSPRMNQSMLHRACRCMRSTNDEHGIDRKSGQGS
jgi:hypothetical protein